MILYNGCPAGRARCARGGHFVTRIPVWVAQEAWGLALLGGGCLCCGDVVAGLGPVGDESVDDDVAYAVGVVEGGKIGAVLEEFGLGEALGGRDAGALLVVVARGAENEDAVDVHFVGLGEPSEGLESAGVFHAADGVGAAAVGLVFDPVASPLVEELAVPEGGGGEVVAAEDEGWAMGGFVRVLHASGGDFWS